MAVRIRLQTRNARNASTKFRKTSESKKAEKSLEISAFLVFSCLHLNQTRIMAGVAGFEPARCKSQSLVPYRLATPQYRPPQCSTKLIICQCFFEDFYSGAKWFILNTITLCIHHYVYKHRCWRFHLLDISLLCSVVVPV